MLVGLLHSLGLMARHGPVSFDDVLALAGSKPLAIGGASPGRALGRPGRADRASGHHRPRPHRAELFTLARSGEYRGEPGVYRCATCGRAFTFFV